MNLISTRLILAGVAISLWAQRPLPVNNEWVRVVIANSAPGPKGRMHKHDVNRVMIYLDKGTQRLEYEDGSKKDIVFSPGDAVWDAKGGLHTSQNVGDGPFRVIEVELKKDGKAGALPPVKAAPGAYKLEFENDQVRVLRAKLAPGQAVDDLALAAPRIVIPLTELDVKATAADGIGTALKGRMGDVIFDQSGYRRQENLLPTPAEFLVIELKG